MTERARILLDQIGGLYQDYKSRKHDGYQKSILMHHNAYDILLRDLDIEDLMKYTNIHTPHMDRSKPYQIFGMNIIRTTDIQPNVMQIVIIHPQ